MLFCAFLRFSLLNYYWPDKTTQRLCFKKTKGGGEYFYRHCECTRVTALFNYRSCPSPHCDSLNHNLFILFSLLTLTNSSCSSCRSSSVKAGGGDEAPSDITASSPTSGTESGCCWEPGRQNKKCETYPCFIISICTVGAHVCCVTENRCHKKSWCWLSKSSRRKRRWKEAGRLICSNK